MFTTPIIAPVSADLIRQELTPDKLLRATNKGGNEIYVFHASTAPETMREIGRLREEAFRFYGGGTGRDCDVDEFDLADDGYRQLIVWDPAEGAILGGYRFMFGDEVQMDEATGRPRLATAELFEFSPRFLADYLPVTIELGRSFVSLPYQSTRMGAKSLFALDNLWDGLGALTVLNPAMKYFYGKVTMYEDYDPHARNLILYFLDKHFPDPDHLVRPTDPLPIVVDEAEIRELFPTDDRLENYRALNKAVREIGLNIPPAGQCLYSALARDACLRHGDQRGLRPRRGDGDPHRYRRDHPRQACAPYRDLRPRQGTERSAMDQHLKTGATGEELACRYLERHGYSILERNWRHQHREIDIIAQWGETLVIAEVKTRGVGSFAEARTTVTREKQAFLISAANAYIRQRALDLEVRYDILALDIASDGSYTIEHIPSAFYPQLAGHRTGRKSGRPHR